MDGSFLTHHGFVRNCGIIGKLIHKLHQEQGFWYKEKSMTEVALKIMHAVSELAEAYECARNGGKQPDKNILDFTGLEVQLADALGILLDLQESYGLRISKALLHKMEFNKTRPYKHGKEF